MKTNRTNHVLQLRVALAFPLVAICVGLQSCSEDGPKIPSEDAVEGTAPVKNLFMRSPEEAIDIAQRAWDDFYGDGASPASRSGRCVIDYGRPVEVVRGAKSRGGSGSDTLLYVVNFADEGGFAVIAAPRHADELLAVTSQGHYYPESHPDQEAVPGFELWMENARAYAASFPWESTVITVDTAIIGPYIPINPPGGDMPPVTFDSTRVIGPGNPNTGRLQQKEWEDTTFKYVVRPQVRNSWGQGIANLHKLNYVPEGYLFKNGLCGCGPLAVAQVCMFFKTPANVTLKDGSCHKIDWDQVCQHRSWKAGLEDVCFINQDNSLMYCDCIGSMSTTTHNMIAWLCKGIGEKADADDNSGTGTSTNKNNLLKAIKFYLGLRVITNSWTSFYNTNVLAGRNEIMIVRSKVKLNGKNYSGHVWICDGARWIEYDHCFATRENSSQPWTLQTKNHIVEKYNHFNWGWFGKKNGWFNQAVISFCRNDGSNDVESYVDFEYVMIG